MLLNGKKIGFIGAGNMASAVIKGLIGSRLVSAEDICASDPDTGRLDDLNKDHNIHNFTDDNISVAENCDIIIIAVKPQAVETVMESIRSVLRQGRLIISIAAGIHTDFYEQYGRELRVIRVMPNTPALVGEGASAVCGGRHASKEDVKLACALFGAVGRTVVVAEKQMDAVTGLSGSGPAYVFKFIEAFTDAGVKSGLSRDVAGMLAAQTVYGSAKMVLETGKHPMELKDMVTSPAGTTIAGVYMLEKGGFAGTVIDAVEAAVKRSEELGKK
jgi:pyrroline-5-carboxylate reductase